MDDLVPIIGALVALALTATIVLVDTRPAGRPSRAERRTRAEADGARRPVERQTHAAEPPRSKRSNRSARGGRRARRSRAKAAPVGGGAGAIDIAAVMRGGPDSPIALPLPIGVESIEAATATGLAEPGVGQPASRPDPARLIQTEVLEVAGPLQRIGAAIRLVIWVVFAGLGIGAIILGTIRGIVVLFESLLGV